MSWDKKFIGLTNYIATWSKDNSTKVGAVIVNNDYRVLSIGYNGFPVKVNDDVESRHIRPEKYKWVVHAEENAIVSCSRLGVSTKGTTLYCNYKPCEHCAKLIIQAGIIKVVYENEFVNSQKNNIRKSITKTLFYESNVRLVKYQNNVK